MNDVVPHDLRLKLNALLDEAFHSGFRAGASYTRTAILNAVKIPEDISLENGVDRGSSGPSKPRARRGAVSAVISQILTAIPGATMKEIEDYAPTVDATVSLRSLSGEIRRFKGDKYIQRNQRWYLKGTESDVGGAAGVEAPAADLL